MIRLQGCFVSKDFVHMTTRFGQKKIGFLKNLNDKKVTWTSSEVQKFKLGFQPIKLLISFSNIVELRKYPDVH